jgi:tight adherence protein C
MTPLLVCGWVALAATAAVRLRPVPNRLPVGVHRVEATGAAERLGRWLFALAHRPGVDALAARRLGLTAIAVAVVAPIGLVATFPAGALGWALPGLGARRAARRHLAAVERSLPEVVDLLMLAAGAGLSVRQGVAAVAARTHGPLGPLLARAVAEAERGRRLADALEDVPGAAGEMTRALVAPLIASERYGAPLVPALERLAVEVRAATRRRAEEGARRVPVKLLFPLVVCILPAFGLLTVAPLIASAIRSLRL